MTQKPVFMEGIFTLRNARSMGAAALIEILIAAGIAGLLIWQRLQPSIEQPHISTPPVIEVPQPIPPQPRAVPEAPQPQQPRLSQVPPIPTDMSGPNVQPVEPVQPPLVPGSIPPSQGVIDEFGARMLRAIDAAKVYPKVEMLKGDSGEAVVSFDYVDGVVSNVRVDKSTGFHDLDQAAIDAVKKAALPAKPAELAGLTHFVFQLDFDINN